MTPEIALLTLSAAVIALIHTVLGPDHYLPFIAMAKARDWSLQTTIRVTLACGIGHLIGSVILGLVGISLGTQLSSLEWLEGVRGGLAAWLLIGFGLMYMAWGLRLAYRNRPHSHWHTHAGSVHRHEHSHHGHHVHVHESGISSFAPWVIFIIFILGPCEPLIPLLMYPAAQESLLGVLLVTIVFGLITVATMTAVVAIAYLGLNTLRLNRFERFNHAVAGCAILVCGLGVAVLGI